MAFSKAPLFPEREYNQSLWNKVQAHPARIIILEYLMKKGSSSFKIICKLINLAPTTVSQHLRKLREENYIQPHTVYPHTYYSINESMRNHISVLLKAYRKQFRKIKKR